MVFFGISNSDPDHNFIPGIWDFLVSFFYPRDSGFFQSRNFYPRNSGFLLISGFLSPRFSQNPRDSGIFTFGISRDFFRGMGYPDKKPPLLTASPFESKSHDYPA